MANCDRVVDVLVVGSINVDLVVTLARRPAPGETVLGETMQHSPGGKGANQALAAARAGARTGMVGAVGADHYGSSYLRGLEAQGVDTSFVAVLANTGTGIARIDVTPDGENSIVVIAGANARLGPEHLPDRSGVRSGGVVLSQLEVPMHCVLAATELAAAAGARFVLNPSPMQELGRELLAACDPLVVNLHEARRLVSGDRWPADPTPDEAEAMAVELLSLGPRSVVITLGATGAVLVRTEDGAMAATYEPAPPVEVVDTTGAGDAFAGAFAAVLAGTGDGTAALSAAVWAGSSAATWPGAQPWQLDEHGG